MAKKRMTGARKSSAKAKATAARAVKKAVGGSRKAQAKKGTKPKAKARRARVAVPTMALPRTIIETSPLTLSTDAVGPTFGQIQVAAYHRWLQFGGSDLENWTHAEDELRRSKE